MDVNYFLMYFEIRGFYRKGYIMKRFILLLAMASILLMVVFKGTGFLMALLAVFVVTIIASQRQETAKKLFTWNNKVVRNSLLAVSAVLLFISVGESIHAHTILVHEEEEKKADSKAADAIKFSAKEKLVKTDASGKFTYQFMAKAKKIEVDYATVESGKFNAKVKKIGRNTFELTGDISALKEKDSVDYTLYLEGDRSQEKERSVTVQNQSDAHKKYIADRQAASSSKAASEQAASSSKAESVRAASSSREASISASEASSAASSSAAKASSVAAEQQEADANTSNYSYALLMKSDDHTGDAYHLTGTVFQAESDDGVESLLVDIDGSSDLVYAMIDGTTDAVEGSTVSIYGRLIDRYSYSTKIGGSNTVPAIIADSDDVAVQ